MSFKQKQQDSEDVQVEIDAVLSLLKKTLGPFSASFLFFTGNKRQIMPQIYSGVKNLSRKVVCRETAQKRFP